MDLGMYWDTMRKGRVEKRQETRRQGGNDASLVDGWTFQNVKNGVKNA